jgi:hypothetical protein
MSGYTSTEKKVFRELHGYDKVEEEESDAQAFLKLKKVWVNVGVVRAFGFWSY